jgi:hypothetical protein
VDDPFNTREGAVVSVIVTVLLVVQVFPEVSVLEYPSVYTHGTFIFTAPEVATGIVPIQITVSV